MSENRSKYLTHHTEVSLKESARIMETVTINLKNYLTVKKRSIRDFKKWTKTQDCPGGSGKTISRWVGMSNSQESKERNLRHADTRALCLIASYMNKPVQDVMFSDIPLKNL